MHVQPILTFIVLGAGKGEAYINGNSIGRYCSLGGECEGYMWCAFFTECGEPNPPATQTLYHIPPDCMHTYFTSIFSFSNGFVFAFPLGLNPHGSNTIVLFEQLGAPAISQVSIVVVS